MSLIKNKLFETLDKNKDGYITVKELQEATKDMYNDIDVKNILMSVDLDKNGAINYSEFIAATMSDIISKDVWKVQAAFKFFDKDNDGEIDKNDLKKILESNQDLPIDEELINEIVKEWDYNGDGIIDYSEFFRWMSAKLPTFTK
jgi:calcium-dependent protein kinase